MAEKELAKIVGAKNVLNGVKVLEKCSKDMSFVHPVRPRCVVRPKDGDEVQRLVKWANETLTPLVPVSSGPPHCRGDTVPSTGGAVIVDLSGMKEIIRVDRRNRVAMIEPGVTFSELIPELEQEGLRPNMPLLPRRSKSVIGSSLEREPVIMPLFQWDAIDPLSCAEIIFGSGDVFRTGTAAGPGTLEEQWQAKQAQVNPMGPGQTDFARVVQGSQGTLGIVSWATIRCEVLPTLKKPFLVGSGSLEKLSELIYRMLWLKFGSECLVLNSSSLAAIMAKNPGEYDSLRSALPQWLLFFCLAGYEYFPEERVEYQEKAVLEAAKQFGVEPVSAISGVSAYELLRMLEKPSEEPYWKLRHKGAYQDILFLTTLERVPGFVKVMQDIAEQQGYPSSDMGIYVQPMVQGTSCHCEFNLFYNPANAREVTRVRELYTQAGEALMKAGAFFSRPYGALADMAYRSDGETTAALRKVKKIFDPNNIMNSGKLCF
jgi:FAD/FMN-containing dehydrogenase